MRLIKQRGGGGREEEHACTKLTTAVSGRPANIWFTPDGVVVDLRVYRCWNGGLCGGQSRGFPLPPPL